MRQSFFLVCEQISETGCTCICDACVQYFHHIMHKFAEQRSDQHAEVKYRVLFLVLIDEWCCAKWEGQK